MARPDVLLGTQYSGCGAAAYRKDGFASVLYLEVPGIGHAMPPAAWLERGLEYLDEGKEVAPIHAK